MDGRRHGPAAAGRERLPLWAGLHVAVALFGVAGLFGKWVQADPLWIVFGRVAVASIAMGVLYLIAFGLT